MQRAHAEHDIGMLSVSCNVKMIVAYTMRRYMHTASIVQDEDRSQENQGSDSTNISSISTPVKLKLDGILGHALAARY